MAEDRQPRRMATPAKIAKDKTGHENPNAFPPALIDVRCRPNCRDQHDGSGRAKERLRPTAKHEAAAEELHHDWRCNGQGCKKEENSGKATVGSIEINRFDRTGSGNLENPENGHDDQGFYELVATRPLQVQVLGKLTSCHSDCNPKHGDRRRMPKDRGSDMRSAK